MLGIKKYRGIAVDLWLGPWSTFVCDGKVYAEAQAGDFLKDTQYQGLRHLALVIVPAAGEKEAAAQFSALRQSLDQLPRSSVLKRITFILNNKPQYFCYQTALFQLFSEQ